MRIAYGKLGRSIPLTLDDASNVGGDIEVVRLLDFLRRRHEVHLVGRNRADVDVPGVVNHWAEGGIFYDCPAAGRSVDDAQWLTFKVFLDERVPLLPKFDAWVIWLGQHGSSLHPVPAVQEGKKGTFTSPLISLVNYGYPLVHMLNVHQARPIWLCPDPRNMVKFRDLWDPAQRTILAQYDTRKNNTFFDERDSTLREGATRYAYSGIELLAVPPVTELIEEHAERYPFGILVNEGPTNVPNRRLDLVKKWLPGEYEIFGHWTDESQRELGREIYAVDVKHVPRVLRRWRSTITFPASNTGWATAKPWEAFSAGTVCFKHPLYDDQCHIFGDHMPQELRQFLVVQSPSQLADRIQSLENDDLWHRIIRLQFDYYQSSQTRLEEGYRGIREALCQVD